MIITEANYLAHYGVLRRSGRYPWGSGGPATASNKGFLDYVADLKKQGLSESEIARGMGIVDNKGNPSTTALRAANSIAKNQQKQEQIAMASRLQEKGYSNVAIGKRMGINESSVRSLLAPGAKERVDNLHTIANMLRDQVEQKGYLDIGKGVENHLGISKEKLHTAVAILREEGYTKHYFKVPQLGTGLPTSQQVLAKPGVTGKEAYANRFNVKTITDFSDDGGRTFFGIQAPLSISSKRVAVVYKEDGGAKADGVMYVRPGVKDVSIGSNRYAQVRVAVDGTHYLKGMAIYKNDLPPGVDVVFNTNKSNTGNKLDALKPLTDDKENPFGANIRRQIIEKDSNGKDVVTSAMNLVNEEGSWEKWSRNLSSQTLSKQSPKLAKEQLAMTYERRKNEFDGIMALTNPAVKRKLLETFAASADSSAVHLKAAALPRSSFHVILPVNSMKEHEIYAPNFRNGERVALIRYPHAGTFEIPELTVNNRNAEAKSLVGNARDAVGIHHTVAEHLSGADFDGDFVLVIPNNSGKIKTSSPLEGLKQFDPQMYKLPADAPHMTAKTKGQQMGLVSNLITDMTLKKASTQELAQAVRHSMVVIDAEKHHLDYKRSARDNGIPALMKKYQGKSVGGASTLISRAKSEVRVPMRVGRRAAEGGPIDRATGKKFYTPTGEMSIDKRTGLPVLRTFKSQKLKETEDAHTLSSGTPIEKVYADHSNRLKDLANQARKAQINTASLPVSNSAKLHYADEVKSLNHKLNVALMNAPLERHAQVLANAAVSAKRAARPDMDAATLKKVNSQALNAARARTSPDGKELVKITETEWKAIQAGAISNHKLKQILDNTDIDAVKKLATPREALLMTTTKTSRAKTMIDAGYTQAEIADQLGVSLTTLKTALGGG